MPARFTKTGNGVWAVTSLILFLSAPALAEDAEGADWAFELEAGVGVAVLSYEERLGTVKSDYLQAGYTFRMSLEGNLAGVAPYLQLETAFFLGDETFEGVGFRQENDSRVSTFTVDVGCGYRIDLEGPLTFVPGIGYTYGVLAFERSNFEVNGVPTIVVDLDGAPLSEVDEDLFGHGITLRIALEADLEIVELGFHVDYTYYANMKVVNDVGGTTNTEGGQLRAGLSATFWFGQSFGFVAGGEFSFMALDKSDIELEAGAATVATVQYPNSETYGGTLTFGIRARF